MKVDFPVYGWMGIWVNGNLGEWEPGWMLPLMPKAHTIHYYSHIYKRLWGQECRSVVLDRLASLHVFLLSVIYIHCMGDLSLTRLETGYSLGCSSK